MNQSLPGIWSLLITSTIGVAACEPGSPYESGEGVGADDEFLTGGIQENTREARGVLAVANQVSLDLLVAAPEAGGVGVDERAADNLVAYRVGDDAVVPSEDDEKFESLKELDAIPRISSNEFIALLRFARDHGFVETPETPKGSGQEIWVSTTEGGYVRNIGHDPNDNIVLQGKFQGTVRITADAEPISSIGSGWDDFIAKVDRDGAPLWSRAFDTKAMSIMIRPDRVQVFVDGKGEILIALDPGVALNLDVGCGATEVKAAESLLAKLDTDGACLWSRALPLPKPSKPLTTALATDGRIAAVGGGLPLTIFDATGEVVATLPFGVLDGAALAFGPEGEIAVAGLGPLSNDYGGGPVGATGAGLQIAKLDANLGHQWSQGHASVNSGGQHAVSFGPGGTVVVASPMGKTANVGGSSIVRTETTSVLIAAFTSQGHHLWSTGTSFGLERAWPGQLRVGADGAVYVTAAGQKHTEAPHSTMVAKLEPGGRLMWANHSDKLTVLDIDGQGRILTGGAKGWDTLYFGAMTP
jgi:hypothetical protein